MSGCLSPGTKAAVPNLQCGLRGEGLPAGEAGVQGDSEGALGRNQGSPGGPCSLPPLSQQGRKQIYFGVSEPHSPLPSGLGPAVGGSPLGSSVPRAREPRPWVSLPVSMDLHGSRVCSRMHSIPAVCKRACLSGHVHPGICKYASLMHATVHRHPCVNLGAPA